MNYIGTDVHPSTLAFKVVNEAGKIKKAREVPTGALSFMAFVKSVPKPRKIFIDIVLYIFLICKLKIKGL
jgi:hypothetical protein